MSSTSTVQENGSREKCMNTDSERGFLVDLAEHAFKSSQDQVQGRPNSRL